MNAARFNQYMGTPNLAASLHFVRGYDVTYDSNTGSDSIEVTLFQFATAADATASKAGYVPGGPINSRSDPGIPGADDYDSTSRSGFVRIWDIFWSAGANSPRLPQLLPRKSQFR
jgi:hypothetical protein